MPVYTINHTTTRMTAASSVSQFTTGAPAKCNCVAEQASHRRLMNGDNAQEGQR
jgi:hypothetical protein